MSNGAAVKTSSPHTLSLNPSSPGDSASLLAKRTNSMTRSAALPKSF
jgi:hypothetical protein